MPPATPVRAASDGRFSRSLLIACVLGAAVSGVVTRGLFSPGPGEFVDNHDHQGYGLRLIEFRETLARGYVFPQWCPHFRGGLGAPFFAYYQPGFFYAGSLTPASWPMARQIAATSFVFGVVGFIGMWGLTRRFAGDVVGGMAATLLLTAPYVYAELFVRGDYSEYAAMMLIPGFLWGLTAFMDDGDWRAGWGGACAGALVVITHPAVALVTFGFIALLVSARTIREPRVAGLRGVACCAGAVGLSAFYWLPVFAESRWVSAEEAWSGRVFDGYYHYSKHLLPLSWMIGPGRTPTPIPVKLGLVHGLAAALGVAAFAVGWRRTDAPLRHMAWAAGLFFAAALWLITPSSEFVWRTAPLLARVQFPWRLLALVSVGGALAAAVGLASLRRPALARFVSIGLSLAALALAAVRPGRPVEHVPEPATAAEIADGYFAPDLADEWLPRGAKPLRIAPARRRPASDSSGVTIENYAYDATGLRCDVRASSAARITLPHYYFPAGWEANFDDAPVELAASPDGLMRCELPAGADGTLLVRWRTTPGKRVGAWLSALTALLGCAATVLTLRRARRTRAETPTPRPGSPSPSPSAAAR